MTTCQIFTEKNIVSLREGGKILSDCLQYVSSLVEPGRTTKELDESAEAYILKKGGRPAFKGYMDFSATLCLSLNDEIVHGIPGNRKIAEGDVVSIDCGVIYDDLYTDACVTVVAGKTERKTEAFLACVSKTLEDVITGVVRAGVHVGSISSFIQKRIEKAGYTVVRQLTGHGLGTTLHQFPDVPNWGKENMGPLLPAHTLIAIEPIAIMGKRSDIVTDDDGWTIRTKDGSLACHFEHSVLITENGCEIIA